VQKGELESPKKSSGKVPIKKKNDFSVPSNILKEADNKPVESQFPPMSGQQQ